MRRFVAFLRSARLAILRFIFEHRAGKRSHGSSLGCRSCARNRLSTPVCANAGCGSAFCTVNADWGTQGLWTEPDGRVDLRFEFIDLKQPKQGATKVGPGEVPEEVEDVQTINRNWIAAFDYNFDGHLGVSATVLLVNRYHDHRVDPEGAQTTEQWAFTELGDVRVQGRYRFIWARTCLSARVSRWA